MRRPNRKTRRAITHPMVFRQPPQKKKNPSQMSDEELQDEINNLEYKRIKLPKTNNIRMANYRIELTRQINMLRGLLNARKKRG